MAATARTLWSVYAHLPACTSLPFPCLHVVYVFCLTSIVIMTCDNLGSTSFTAGRKGAESTTDQASLCVFVWMLSKCIFIPSICMKSHTFAGNFCLFGVYTLTKHF